jgi:serine/threonine-protein kinase HipA
MMWGKQIGAVEWDGQRDIGIFQYTPEFASSNIQPSPIVMPTTNMPYMFPALRQTFHSLPGLVADSLPDKYGHRLIDAWLISRGRKPESMNPVERLCYIGRRGMGALEYDPELNPMVDHDQPLNIAALAHLANQVLSEREDLGGLFGTATDSDTVQDILRVGTCAGGARAKALVAWNPETGEFRSEQLNRLDGFEHWLLKFDGVNNNRDRELADPNGYGFVEYAYSMMAREAGIIMMPCRLLHEGGRSHFMTRRFDRTEQGKKLHMLSLAALCHYDYHDPSSYSYEQALHAIRLISAAATLDAEQQFLRAAFNLIARNQDDHVKNIAFLMDAAGQWRLAPAFDVAYAWNPKGNFTAQHQMSVNGKRDNFEPDDLLALGRAAGIKTRKAKALIAQIVDSVRNWPVFAREAGVSDERTRRIAASHRLELATGIRNT